MSITSLDSWKIVLTIAIVGLLVINSILDPHNLTFFIGESRPEYKPDTRAAAFALITAIAAFVNTIPSGCGKIAFATHIVAKLAPLAGAALSGWFWLYAATGKNPVPYLQEIGYISLIFVVLAIVIAMFLFSFSVFVSIVIFICSTAWKVIRASYSITWKVIRASRPKIKAMYQRVGNCCSLIRTALTNQIHRFFLQR